MYEGIPHLLTPVVTDMKDAANALRWCVAEMDRRYRLMSALGVRNIGGYNRKVKDAIAAGEPIKDPTFTPPPFEDEEKPIEHPTLTPLPFIVVIIDELADMMMIVGKKIEEVIARLAQKARASGIHMLLATQRPSVDVITGSDQSQYSDPHRIPGIRESRFPHDSRPGRRGESAGARRHVVSAAGDVVAAACARRVRGRP